MSLDPEDLADWADSILPDLYDPGMYDAEEIHEDVWDSVEAAIEEMRTLIPGDHEEIFHATAHDWFAIHHTHVLDALQPATTDEIAAFQARPQVSQHSADWYAQRRNRLTASEFAQILDGRAGALLRSKVAPVAAAEEGGGFASAPVAIAQPDGEMNATSWGHRYEPIVRTLTELELTGVDTICDTLGRFTHPTIPWLSASPDGVVLRGPMAGRLVEIKSPKTRQPGTFVPDDYYIQMQLQMEVCGAEAVEFVEAQFAQQPIIHLGVETSLTSTNTAAVGAATWKGRIAVYGDVDSPETWIYWYSPPVEDLEDASLPPATHGGRALLESSVWWLTGWFPRTVLRNRGWWSSVGWPAAEAFWAEVEALRLTPTPTPIQMEMEGAPTGWLGEKSP